MHLKVLVIDRSPPMSLRQGNALIGWEVFSRLSRHHLTLVAPATADEAAEAPQRLGPIFRELHLVPRAAWTPALAGGLEARLAGRLRSAPRLDLRAAVAFKERVREVASARTYDVVHVRQLPMAPYASGLRSSGRLLELIDSETLGAERALPRTARTRLRARLAAQVERRAMKGFDVVTTVAEADAARLRQLVPEQRVEVVPNGVDAERFRPQAGVEPVPGSLVFVGAMSYPPNVAAMRHFCADVLPLLRRSRPDVQVTIVGRDPAPAVRELESQAGVQVTGEVEDVRSYLAGASVFVAPMISGSGIKNKVLEAMAMGRPVVATALAAEGLPVTSGEHVVVADGARPFAEAVARLIDDRERRETMGRAARGLVERHYTWDACAATYERLYEELAARGLPDS